MTDHEYLFYPGNSFGRFEVVKPLAHGFLGEVYYVKDDYGIEHALKVELPANFLRSDDRSTTAYHIANILSPIERVTRQVQILGGLSHPNIMKVSGVIADLPKGAAGLLMERIGSSITLEDLVKDFPKPPFNITPEDLTEKSSFYELVTYYSGYLRSFSATMPDGTMFFGRKPFKESLDDAISLLGQLRVAKESDLFMRLSSGFFNYELFFKSLHGMFLSALYQLECTLFLLYDKKIAHLDIRPPNLLFDSGTTLKVVDFGLSQKIGVSKGENFLFSRRAAPPEAFHGEMHPSFDLFSFGLMLHYIVRGHHPLLSKEEESSEGKQELLLTRSNQVYNMIRNFNDTSLVFAIPLEKNAINSLLNLLRDYYNTFIWDLGVENQHIILESGRTYGMDGRYEFENSMRSNKSRIFRWFSYLNLNPSSRLAFLSDNTLDFNDLFNSYAVNKYSLDGIDLLVLTRR